MLYARSYNIILSTCMHAVILTPTDTGRVLALSWDYRAKWRLIGIELGIDSGTLDAIEANNRKVEDCLGEMIKIWLRKNQPKPTLNAITAALKSRRVTATAGKYKVQKLYKSSLYFVL